MIANSALGCSDIFLIFVVVRIVRDELERSAKWDSRVRREEKRLQDSYPVQYGKDSDIKELDYQFNLQELTLEEEVDLKKNWLKNHEQFWSENPAKDCTA